MTGPDRGRQTALVVAPGRGSYGPAELGYLARHHGARGADVARFDAVRAAAGQTALTALDGAAGFDPALHLAGDHAAPLIYAAGWCDFLAIDRARWDIVAVTGNSMGWYSALACGGAVSGDDGFAIANAMGVNSGRHGPGGQLLVPLVDADWHPVPGLRDAILHMVAAIAARPGHAAALSIDLGGVLVLAGDAAGLAALAAELPAAPGRVPVVLPGHGPFHTPLMQASADAARAALAPALFGAPALPLIDGRGHVWRPLASDRAMLWDYTLGHQILAPYDFAAALRVAVREYAPDRIILLGPGDSMGAPVAQILIGMGWHGLGSKADFSAAQAADPLVLAMGRPAQRALVMG